MNYHLAHPLSNRVPWLIVKAGHDVSGQPRDDHGRWTAAFIDWYESAGRTAGSKTDAEHSDEAELHRSNLMKMPLSRLKKIADHIGYHIRPGTPKDKIVSGLIGTVTTRRGMAIRSEQ